MAINDKDKIPNGKKCRELMEKHQMLPNIRQHSFVVCKVALTLAQKLNKAGENLNLAEIKAAALLHDITKTSSLQSGDDHAETGAQLLKELGYERIAEIVRGHITPQEIGKTLNETALICYADKRVKHDKMVSLDERFDYLLKKYGKNDKSREIIISMKTAIKQIENKICKRLGGS